METKSRCENLASYVFDTSSYRMAPKWLVDKNGKNYEFSYMQPCDFISATIEIEPAQDLTEMFRLL